MMNDSVLDEVVPIPDREALKTEIIEDLKKEGFQITNFSSGGIFYTIIMIFIQIKIELVKLLRKVLLNMFISSAKGIWLDLKGADYSKKKKPPTKTKGYVTLKRNTKGSTLKVPQGYVFKTDRDINGEEYSFVVVQDSIMGKDLLTIKVLVEAEKEGSKYNLPPGQINKSLIHLEGIDEITNEVGWIAQEGSNLEDEESFRDRTSTSWAELSTYPIRDKYKNVCEAVPGVLFATVDDLHPRGQGSIDIIITSTAGEATQSLIDDVTAEAEKIKAPYDNILVKSAEVISQDLSITLYISSLSDETGLEEKAKATIATVFTITKNRNLNELYKADIIFALKRDIEILKNVKITAPTEDIALDKGNVIVLGNVNVTVEKV